MCTVWLCGHPRGEPENAHEVPPHRRAISLWSGYCVHINVWPLYSCTLYNFKTTKIHLKIVDKLIINKTLVEKYRKESTISEGF